MNIFRHGDLLIKELDQLPENLTQKQDNIIAYGEATGHHHQLTGKVTTYVDKTNNKIYFVAEDYVKLKHQEHKTINISEGNYEVIVEREYDYFAEAIAQVQD